MQLTFAGLNVTLTGSITPPGLHSNTPIYYSQNSALVGVDFMSGRAVTNDGYRMYFDEGTGN